MTLRQLSKTHFLPEGVQEVIWGFGWHLNLGVITVLQCCVVDDDDQPDATHYIHRVFVKQNIPGVMDMFPGIMDVDAYKAILGIPRCFDAVGRPKVWLHSPFAIGILPIYGYDYGYNTFAGIDTWVGCRQENKYYEDLFWGFSDPGDDSDDSDDGSESPQVRIVECPCES